MEMTRSVASRTDSEGREINDYPGTVSAAAVVNIEGCRYEVFLSFKELFPGGISDHLYNALRDAGLRVFRSTPKCSNEVALQAIRESKICIPIFSKHYASTKWCLRELAVMYELMKKGNPMMILPVFYDVTPSDVQMQPGLIQGDLQFLEREYGGQLWREALSEVVRLDGMDLVKLANGHETQLIKLVTLKVLKLLRDTASNPVGLDSRIRALEELIRRHAEEDLARRRTEEKELARRCAEEGLELARRRAKEGLTRRRAKEDLRKEGLDRIRAKKDTARGRAEEKEPTRRRAEEGLARRRAKEDLTLKPAKEDLRKEGLTRIRAKKDLARRHAEEELALRLAGEDLRKEGLARIRAEKDLARRRVEEGLRYDVFLSYSEITTMKFTKHLYNALIDAGFHVFRANKPTSGYPDEPVIQALRESKICIPIFSQDYATSGWCLSELALMYELMKESTHMILPVFYDASPSDVQMLTGFFGRLFQINESNFDLERVQLWREALSGVGSLKGMDLVKLAYRHETQATKLVISKVLKLLRDPASNLVSNNLVGLDSRLETIMGKLDFDANDVRMLGIHGMGGIGKTTLANVVYDRISNHFRGNCFLRNVRDTSSRHGFKHLQSQLIKEILEDERQDLGFDSKHILQHRLRNKKVLIVLDDVDTAKQIDELAGNFEWFGPGSRIIVTTRNRAVLPEVEGVHEYEVQKLDEHDAFLLFCKNAFKQNLPPEELASLSSEITSATGGLPLSVETIGSYLFAEKTDVWRGALDRLKSEPKIQDRLMISYNILDDNQKQMFLDMACFFVGSDVTIPTHMWRSCNLFSDAGAEVLSLMSMIKITDDKKIWVHDHFIDLAKDIVLRESNDKRRGMSRLWGPDAVKFLRSKKKFLRSKKGSREVQAIRLDCEMGSEPIVISDDKFDRLVNLQYLDLGNVVLDGGFHGRRLGSLRIFHRKLSNLRWLGWHGDTEFHIPPSICVKNLVVLDLSKSTVKETWNGWSLLKEAKNLEVLNLTGCHHLKITPDLSSFPCMERLIFRDCSILEMIDSSVGYLTRLISLDVRNCPRLRALPKELGSLGQVKELLMDETSIAEIPELDGMNNLEMFSARFCKSLRQISKSFESLVKVRKILLDNCESLEDIDANIGQLESLQELSLSGTKIVHLPNPIKKWSNLKMLNIDHCPIRELPASLWNLSKLEVLNASGCLNLGGEIPYELENLTSLRTLRLDHTDIGKLPATIERLTHLHTLNLEGCMKLQSLPRLPVSLANLKVTLTSSVTILNLPDLIHLEILELQHCNSLSEPRHKKENLLSSSFELIQPGYEYEVFLSFRGPDTRESFTDVLYKRLTEVGVRTFRDNEELHVGEEIGGNLLQAINQSKISIPIFSKGYASSKWCLMEAAKMVECMETRKQKVLPIFFDVIVDEVKHQNGCYEKSFFYHVESKNHEARIIEDWRNALKKIGAQKGLRLGASASGSWGTVLEELVSKILKKLKKPYLDVSENLVGIEDHVEEVVRLLEADANDVKMIGLWGMGGIGKTTIVKFIFNQLAKGFEYRCCLENVRGTSMDSERLIALQTQLASAISGFKYEKFYSCGEGKSVLKAILREKKVLILIDDVDQTDQLNCLVGDFDWFGPGSRIFITTRVVDVLRKTRVNWIEYDVKEMSPHNAFLLFCKHAFRQDSPLPAFEGLSWDVVKATGRLPLAIQAIGSSLSTTTDKKVWEEAVNSLKTKKDILDKLAVSYEALSLEQKEVFLDIACLFKGSDHRIPFYMWKARQFSPMTTLQDLLLRSLIKIRDSNVLWMHDCFIDLGWEIVHRKSNNNPGRQSRLCGKEATEVLEAKLGTKEVTVIHLDPGSDSEKLCLGQQHFEKLSNLQFLGLGDARLDGDLKGSLPRLKWLSWHGRNLLDSSTSLHPKMLVILDLSKSEIYSDWTGWSLIKVAENLEVLNLSSCHHLTRTPDFSTFSKMKRLSLEDCQGLVEVSQSIGKLKNLEFLNLKNCSSLKQLPEEFSNLVALIELLLDGSSINELPIYKDMKNLEIISAKSCGSLAIIRSTIGELVSLKVMNLSGTGVVYLPESLENLTDLEVLNIENCLIQEFPVSLWKLTKLEVINASGCRNLRGDIPADLGSLDSLKVLRLDRSCIASIPESISELSLLRILDLRDCMKLQSLPALPPSLVELKVTLMSSEIEPNLQDLVNLKVLEIVYCGELYKILMNIHKFSKIEKMTITKRSQRDIGLNTPQRKKDRSRGPQTLHDKSVRANRVAKDLTMNQQKGKNKTTQQPLPPPAREFSRRGITIGDRPQQVLETNFTPLNMEMSVVLHEMRRKGYDMPLPPRKDVAPVGNYLEDWCEYHQCNGHHTDHCYQLKLDIEKLIQKGYLGQFVVDNKKRARTPPPPIQHQGKGKEKQDEAPPTK